MKDQKHLHVVAFNVPYPPNYGGVIDIYYKLKALREEGIRIILHCFVYDRPENDKLDEVCEKVFYYRRKRGIFQLLRPIPYIVVTRNSNHLRDNLLKDQYPVLFEGIHTTYFLEKCKNAGKKVLVRTHNIEHNYYRMLSKSARSFFSKLYYRSEARKLHRYEKVLGLADQLLSISLTDTAHFSERYSNSIFVSAFHQNNEIISKKGSGDYILFHGDLSVPENEKALVYLVKIVLSKITFRVIIAGKNPGRFVRRYCRKHANIELIADPDNEKMRFLVENAHINLLYTYQPTGLKLKLLHSLHGGRYCMANPLMVSGSGLEDLCEIYNSPDSALQVIEKLMNQPFSQKMINERKRVLKDYNNRVNAKKIIELL
ncbi:MAG: glycosyltransferase family 1 protein [Bacteroidales bacterium]|nr:glycosyltransferase family 1 protein [Bacteroidales bacterium]